MEIQQFYQRIKNNYKVKVNSRLSSAPATNYCQMLQEVSEVQRFEVSYLDIAEVSSKGITTCKKSISCNKPITTCNMLLSQLKKYHYMKQSINMLHRKNYTYKGYTTRINMFHRNHYM